MMADACMTQLVGCCGWGCGCCLACGLQVGSSPFIWSAFVSVSRVACRARRGPGAGAGACMLMIVDVIIIKTSSRCSCTGSHSHSQRATGVRTHFIVEERLIDDVCMMHVRARMPVDNGSGGGYASS